MAPQTSSGSDYLRLMRTAMPLYDRLQDEVVRASSEIQVASILDLGAGTGETTRRYIVVHPAAHATLVDASPAMLQAARRTLGAHVELKLGRLQDALPRGPFDLVVSTLALHRLHSLGEADLLARVARRLSPGGRVVIGDLVVTDPDVPASAPLDLSNGFPDRLDDQLASLRRAGLQTNLHWADAGLAVFSGSKVVLPTVLPN